MFVCAACAFESRPPAEVEEVATAPLYNLPVRDGQYIFEDEYMGVAFGIPFDKYDVYTIYYGQLGMPDKPNNMPPLDGIQVFFFPPDLLQELGDKYTNDPSEQTANEVTQTLIERSRLLYSIQYYSAGLWDSWTQAGKTIAEITGNAENEELGRQDGRVYIYTEPASDEQGMDAAELAAYREVLAAVPAMRKNAAMLERGAAAGGNVFPEFSASDIYGADIGSDIFAAYDLTMINVWGTFCDPCIMEMPYLAELAADMPPGTQLIGLVGDAVDKDTIELAQLIAEETGAAFPHIVPDKALFDYLNYYIVAYPTTLFIDTNGNIVGEQVIGAQNLDQYEEILDKRLKYVR